MSKKINITESSMINELKAQLKEKYAMLIPDKVIVSLYRVFFRSFALMVKYNSNKKTPRIGFSFKSNTGEFVIGTILTYNAPDGEDAEDAGNWNLTMTFNQDDMADLDNEFDSYNSSFMSIVTQEMMQDCRAHCTDSSDLTIIITEFI